MELFEIIWILTCGLILINVTLLIVCLVKRRISWLYVAIIVPFSILIPYLVAYLVGQMYSGWQAMGNALIAFVYTLFGLMVFLLIYLISKMGTGIAVKS